MSALKDVYIQTIAQLAKSDQAGSRKLLTAAMLSAAVFTAAPQQAQAGGVNWSPLIGAAIGVVAVKVMTPPPETPEEKKSQDKAIKDATVEAGSRAADQVLWNLPVKDGVDIYRIKREAEDVTRRAQRDRWSGQ